MENSKTEIISTSKPLHLILSSTTPQSPSSRSPVNSPAHLPLSSSTETSPKAKTNTRSPPEKSPERTPVHFDINSSQESPSRTNSDRTKPPSSSEKTTWTESVVGPRKRVSLLVLRRAYREKIVKRVGLGFRVFGSVFCLISFSIMAANTNKGWALDSFHHYKEFRYCISVNVIGFVYSAAQAFDLAYHLVTGKSFAQQHPFRFYFDFAIDQMLTYLLISSSSSASTRIDDWKLNWGEDKFPEMATASVSIAFLAFLTLAFSSLLSGYKLCISKSL